MRVLLVYANASRDLLPAPPIGLAYVATATRQAGHEVSFLDLVGSARPGDDLTKAVSRVAPDVVGISVRNIDNVVRQRVARYLDDSRALTAAVRAASSAPIVVGGPAVSILGPSIFRFADADFAVVGEGEETFPRLLAALESGAPVPAIPGVHARTAGPGQTRGPARLARFGASGLEEWIDWRAYDRIGATWPVQSKRGCALACSYCAYPEIEGRLARRRAPAEVVDEIARVHRRIGPRTFEFVDSTFNVPAGHAEALCEALIARRLPLRLTAMGVNPLGASEGLFRVMRRAGFNSMMLTPEAASDSMLRRLRKGFGVAEVERAAVLARHSGMASMWFFMLGGPGETRQTVEETVSFVERHLDWPGCVAIFMTGIRVLPGTALAEEAAREGMLPPGRDLAEPTFYVSGEVEEDWILARINQAMGRSPAVVHAAEEGRSRYEQLVQRALRGLGVAPPFWRFLPLMLRVPPIPALRRRQPPLGPRGLC